MDQILAVTSSLVITEDWGINRLVVAPQTGWMECKGQGGYLCNVCLKMMSEKCNFEKHMNKHM